MKNKYPFIIFPILLVVVFFFIFKPDTRIGMLKNIPFFSQMSDKAERINLHPLANKNARKAALEKPMVTWEDWIKARTEIRLGEIVENSPEIDTAEEVALWRERAINYYTEEAERFKSVRLPPPSTPIPAPIEYWNKWESSSDNIWSPPKYEGQQTVEALMAAFDDDYITVYPRALDWETQYPRKEWLKRFLDKGVVIEDTTDYRFYLKSRYKLIKAAANPEQIAKGAYGVDPSPTLKEYENGFIEREIWKRQIIKKVNEQNSGESFSIFSLLAIPISIYR